MNTPHRPTAEPEDQDIAALFESQSLSVPEELDATILAAAKQATADSLGSQEPNSDSSQQLATRPLSKASSRWFALAATIVVGVSVAPLLLKAPESSLNAPTITSTTEISSNPLAKEASAPAQSTSTMADEDTLGNGGAAGDLLLEGSQTAPASDGSVIFAPVASTALRTESGNSLRKARVVVYRDTVDDWISEIQRLESLGKTNEASAEYKLFRDKHPDAKPDFKLQTNND